MAKRVPHRWREERIAQKDASKVEKETEYAKDKRSNARVISGRCAPPCWRAKLDIAFDC